jgi:excisionase family DNA binding protein
MEKLLDKGEVSEMLGVKIRTLDRWVYEKRIPYIRLTGKSVRFVPSDIRAFLEKRMVKPGLQK